MNANTLRETLAEARKRLLQTRDGRGAFRGQLSASALSTATAAMAFEMAARATFRDEYETTGEDWSRLAESGRAWLRHHQNEDGGFGDTVDSPSNISTTALCWVCLGFDPSGRSVPANANAENWLREACGGLTPERLVGAIRRRYGKDHTFAVPILTTCALGGRLGDDGWRLVPQLPFEFAACPHSWFKLLQLPTVSYALPALIAIGQARHFHRPTFHPITRLARGLTRRRTLRILRSIQPASGGYLEAAPLTSFVVMSLVSMGLVDHAVVSNGLRFLEETVRDDGSWSIDTNLDTWLTSLSVHALGSSDRDRATADWLLGQQYREVHPYTRAAPGGWAWTDLTGGVPDADDTAGALLALRTLGLNENEARLRDAVERGVNWLLDLQNHDGGIPTFCRGWTNLPFDRSGADLTAHALRALAAWREYVADTVRTRLDGATRAGVAYLLTEQRPDGSWVPLWFGNQHLTETGQAGQENPIYGTSRVLLAVASVSVDESQRTAWIAAGERAARFLVGQQRQDGGFGPVPSVEETALAVEALASWHDPTARVPERDAAVSRGVEWLLERTERGTRFDATPIGLYFAKLWYSERLYPLVFTVAALEAARACSLTTSTGGSDACRQTT